MELLFHWSNWNKVTNSKIETWDFSLDWIELSVILITKYLQEMAQRCSILFAGKNSLEGESYRE